MNMTQAFSDITQADMQHRLAKMIMIGTVSEVDYETARVKVKVGDWITTWLPWLTGRASNNLDWQALEIDEQVMVFSPGGDTAQGVVLGSIYQQQQQQLVNDIAVDSRQHIHRIKYQDGTILEYDREQHKLKADVQGDVEINVNGFDGSDAKGNLKVTVKENAQIQVGKDLTALVEGNATLNISKNATMTVGENMDVKAKSISLEASEGIAIKAGATLKLNGQHISAQE